MVDICPVSAIQFYDFANGPIFGTASGSVVVKPPTEKAFLFTTLFEI